MFSGKSTVFARERGSEGIERWKEEKEGRKCSGG
jgi:hypothetical protein